MAYTIETTRSTIILNGSRDWDNWLEMVKSASLRADVWAFVNPNTPANLLPLFQQPIRPSPNTVKAVSTPSTIESRLDSQSQGTLYSDLSLDEREYLRTLEADYNYNLKIYKRQKTGLTDVRFFIQQTINKDFLGYTRKCETPYEMLVNLQKRFAPKTLGRETEVVNRWLALQTAPKGNNLDNWLMKWDATFEDGLELSIPDVQGNRPIIAFIKSVASFNPGFSHR